MIADSLPRRLIALLVMAAIVTFILLDPGREAAPLKRDSHARVRADLSVIAQAPRPAGSRRNAEVMEFLVRRLEEMGLAPEVQRAVVEGTEIANVLVRVPGSDPTGALLLSAHFDTVERSPGASDDGVGVALLLETLRSLVETEAPRNDVILLLTDGEERRMLGAKAFVREHPFAADVSVVINLEAIGNRGRAVLIETGDENGRLIRLFADAVSVPVASSLGGALLCLLPNNTDYTVFRRAGVPGLNLALVDGASIYHSEHDTPERLSVDSIRHFGGTLIELARALAAADLSRVRQSDVAYFDVFRAFLVCYPVGWNLLLAAAALILFGVAALSTRRTRRSWLRMFIGPPALVLLSAASAFCLTVLTGFTETKLLVACCTLAAVAVQIPMLMRSTHASDDSSHVLGVALWFAILLLAGLPLSLGASYLASLPLACVSLAIIAHEKLPERRSWWMLLLIGILVAAPFMILTPVLHQLVGLASVNLWAARVMAALLAAVGSSLLWVLVKAVRGTGALDTVPGQEPPDRSTAR